MLFDQLPQFLLSGLTSGSIYALVAVGFCIIYNATGIVNFAQGEFVMLGAMIMIGLTQDMGISLPLSFGTSIVAAMLLGVFLERVPLGLARSRHVLILVLITVGFSIAARGAASLIWGKTARALPAFSTEGPLLLAGAVISRQALWILVVTMICVALLHLFFQRTVVGQAIRAVADNRHGAVLVGIPVAQMVMVSFALSAGLGATAGILIAPITGMHYSAGVMLGLKGFAAAILGGYGHVWGAVAGGLLLGVLESLAAGFISSAYKDALAFLILLCVLWIRPSGLFGQAKTRRV
ncbi:amino acid/amide ABC transporter membrane protein 1, HAAT family [Desulfonatronum thiosulfatophilum]|uniref:Amino acid/amide ABC transporter membrane protein 1, HAAT family n=1 Tax=Desulfonatronum thiosulfatophilum TaxID=617002 RepID=A0A1G6A8B3_9BACT|nr:branched-chain amino acid ABC transporter permease [Desulfonatronum thiosulfatophilum]SDB04619.1 amino acid/amide ABC transporter membrane protein 1, HAAT family [Desulfonatronum thiosulfatophilum]